MNYKLMVFQTVRPFLPPLWMIGGSCGLYLQNREEWFHDIDVIVPNINEISLPFKELPITHLKRINRTKKYIVRGVKIDFIENKNIDFNYNIIDGYPVEKADDIIKSRKQLIEFYEKEYPKETIKWKIDETILEDLQQAVQI